jgi:ketosteroid isomerase-like protein
MNGTLALPYPAGEVTVAPGGRMSIDAIDLITVGDGEIAEKHTYLDWAAALEQMGSTS